VLQQDQPGGLFGRCISRREARRLFPAHQLMAPKGTANRRAE
jgi:hypothetical protein